MPGKVQKVSHCEPFSEQVLTIKAKSRVVLRKDPSGRRPAILLIGPVNLEHSALSQTLDRFGNGQRFSDSKQLREPMNIVSNSCQELPSQPIGSHPDHAVPWGGDQQCHPGSAVEEEVVQRYLHLVKPVVARIATTLPSHVDSEDIYSAGLIGLLNAVRNFDPQYGASFGTYARLRIRGAIFDELRHMDWVPRSVHAKARQVQTALKELEEVKGRVPTDSEMATNLNISVSEYQCWLVEIRPATYICLDATLNSEDGSSLELSESFADEKQEDPVEGASRKEMIRLIGHQLAKLPDMQRKVLALYYFEDLRLREIAQVFGVTESRISQIRSEAIRAIKSSVRKYDVSSA
jgi:RNA polymerase sigma factor for flagellar operon FliA